MLRVGVVDDSELLRTRLRGVVAEVPEAEIVGEAASLDEARRGLTGWAADVVVLDLRLPDGTGFELLPVIQGLPAAPRVIVLTNHGYAQLRDRCLAAGADFFLDKSTDFEELPDVLRLFGGNPRGSPRPRRRSGPKRRAA